VVCFTPLLLYLQVGVWVGPRAGLDVVEKIIISCSIKAQLHLLANSLFAIWNELSHGLMMYKCPSRALMCNRASVERFSEELVARDGTFFH
jgi:hypothetical protein